MPRQRRLNLTGGVFHIICRGIERRKIFLDNEDRINFLSRLESSLSKSKFQCFAWALMPNHFHLLVLSGDRPLSELMRRLLTGYAVSFNRRHLRVGHVFQNRYKSILCQKDAYLLELVRYIHLNPLRAKLVKGLKSLEKFRWSGHSALCGVVKRDFQEVDEVLSHFGKTKKRALTRYREFISDGVPLGKQPDLVGGGLKRSAGGWIAVKMLKGAKDYWDSDERILGDGYFVKETLKSIDEELDRKEVLARAGWDLERLAKKVCDLNLVNLKDLRKKGRNNNLSRAKSEIAYLARVELGLSRSELSDFFKISSAAITYLINVGEELLIHREHTHYFVI